MAVNTIMRVLAGLIDKHGLARGVKLAQKLGFRNKEIQGAVSKLTKGVTKKPKSTFRNRKADRVYQRSTPNPMGMTDEQQKIIDSAIKRMEQSL